MLISSQVKSLENSTGYYVSRFMFWLKSEYYRTSISNWKWNQKIVQLQLCLLGTAVFEPSSIWEGDPQRSSGGSGFLWAAMISNGRPLLCQLFSPPLSVLSLGEENSYSLAADWWPHRREVTPSLMSTCCKQKENTTQSTGTWLCSQRLGVESCCQQGSGHRLTWQMCSCCCSLFLC